jgi:hypothetical protein
MPGSSISPTRWWSSLVVLALASCSVETHYVPRTPHVLALAMKARQPMLYKDGALVDIEAADSAVHGCPQPVVDDLTVAADRARDARHAAFVGGLFMSAGFVLFPLFVPGAAFSAVASDHEQRADAALVDVINRHNDSPECLR